MSNIIKIPIGKEEVSIDLNSEKIQKMACIYKALDNGWTVKKVTDDKYEFYKPEFKKVDIKNFTNNWLKTKEILKN